MEKGNAPLAFAQDDALKRSSLLLFIVHKFGQIFADALSGRPLLITGTPDHPKAPPGMIHPKDRDSDNNSGRWVQAREKPDIFST